MIVALISARAETEKYLVRSEQLLFQGEYEYKCGGDTHINAGGIRISLSFLLEDFKV